MHTALRYGKVGITWSVVISVIAWSIGLAALLAPLSAAHALTSGDLIKASQAAVYYYGADGKRYVFPNEKTYKTWYADFSSVVTITDTELADIPIGGNVTYKPGVKMVKITTDPKVYAVSKNGTLRWVTTESVASDLYGPNWNQQIDDVPDAFFAGNYNTDGADINDASDFDKDAETAAATSINDDKDITAGGTTGGGSVTVSLAADTPATTLAVNNAAFLPFTKINVTNNGSLDAVIDQMVVERQGLGQDAVFSGVDIIDGDTSLPTETSSKTLNSEHKATFNKNVTVKAGTTKELTITGSFGTNTSYAGEAPVLCLASITMTGGGSASGTLPVCGNYQTINATITIGTANIQRGSYGNASSTTLKVGQQDYTLASIRLNAGSAEKVIFKSIKIYQQGTASLATDLSDIRLLKDGSELLATGVVDGNYVSFVLATPVTIAKGQNLQLVIQADIDSGSTRTIKLGIWKQRDVVVTGATYGYNITTTNNSATCTGCATSSPVLSDNQFTISNGTLAISRSSAVPATNIAVANDQELGAFLFTVKGEPINVEALTLTVASSTSNATVTTASVTSFRLVDENGSTVAGPTDMPTGSTPALTVSWTDNFTAPIGEHVYKVIANLQTNGNWSSNDTITVSFTPSSAMTLTGDTTSNSITASPSSSVSANQQTVKAATLSVTRDSLPANATVITGSTQLLVGSWTFDATASGEDVRVTSVAIAASTTGVANLSLWVDGVKQSPTNDAPSTTQVTRGGGAGGLIGTSTFTTSDPIVVPKGTTKQVQLKADINTSANAGEVSSFGITSSAGITATGADTGNTVTATVTADDGAVLTYATAGTVTISVDSKPAAQIVLGGSTGVNATNVKLASANEAVDVDDLTVYVGTSARGDTATGNYQDITLVTLKNGTTVLASGAIPSTGKRKFTLSKGDLVIPANGSVVVSVYIDFATIDKTNDNAPGTAAADVIVGIGGPNGIKTTGQQSGSTASETYQDSTSSAMVLHMSRPIVAYSSASSRLGAASGFNSATDVNLMGVDVTADSNGGEVLLYRMSFAVATSGSAPFKPDNFRLDADNGSGTIGSATSLTYWTGSSAGGGYVSYTFNDANLTTAGNAGEAVKIASGVTRRFTLVSTLVGPATGDGISVNLLGDTATSSTGWTIGTDNKASLYIVPQSNAGGSFVWSDNFKQGSLLGQGGNNATSTAQWYTGDLVQGLDQKATSSAYSIGYSS